MNLPFDMFGSSGKIIESMFRQMEIAEEEIKAGKKRHPEHEKEIHELFLTMQGYGINWETYMEDIYRAHCRELVERVPRGEKLSIPTNAEMLVGSMAFFTYAAPGRSGVGICQMLFKMVIPEEKIIVKGKDGEVVSDFTAQIEPEWEDQYENEIARMRRSSRVQTPKRDEDFKNCLERLTTGQTYEEAFYQEALF